MAPHQAPVATYRLQLNREFSFRDATGIVSYLDALGVTSLYASPILQARAGSMHGYDVVDASRVNTELGGREQFEALSSALRRHGLGLLLDIVPNHMAIDPSNAAWMDVLAHGRASRYASWFDIAWPASEGPEAEDAGVTVPVLGRTLDEAVSAGELEIAFEHGAFHVRYFEWLFPLEPGSWGVLLARAGEVARDRSADEERLVCDRLSALARRIPSWRGAASAGEQETRRRMDRDLRLELNAAIARSAAMIHDLTEAARTVPLRDVLDAQPYRLCHWKQAMRRLTYRRFFDITHLIGIRVEDPEVFESTHALILELVRAGQVTGLRIDHIDGLVDPERYLRQLKAASESAPCYVVVEKILAADERLDPAWPVSGTTGYDFLNALAGVFVDQEGLNQLADYQSSLIGDPCDFDALMYHQKKRVARELFGGEVAALADRLFAITASAGGGVPKEELASAIVEVSACLPVYRTYITRDHVRERRLRALDRELLAQALAIARDRGRGLDDALSWFARAALLELGETGDGAREALAEFLVTWQQFTGPLAAKGVEDTALYRDARLVSLNVVGADAERIERPSGVNGFHEHNRYIAERWPHTMTTTSTHDTKRSEDVRSRIHVLSEMASDWIAASQRWREMNREHRTVIDEEDAPDVLSELFLYQTMLGAWPLHPSDEEEFVERMQQYAIKAAREAKKRTSWIEPNAPYEAGVSHFVQAILDRKQSGAFLEDFQRLHHAIVVPGAVNALSRTLLKIASPGVPDFYQGTELWDLSLVDPDNRRPVDFEVRQSYLEEIASLSDEINRATASELFRDWRSGRIKMLLTHRALKLRKVKSEVFLDGEYLPLAVSGAQARHVCALARRHGAEWLVAIAAIRCASMVGKDRVPLGEVWTDTTIELPANAPGSWRDAIAGRTVGSSGARLRVADALALFPVALMASQP